MSSSPPSSKAAHSTPSRRHSANEDDITIFRAPGAFEIPFIAQKLAQSGKFDAVICLGAVIRGSTPHNVYISSEVTKGIAQAAMTSGIPVIFGVLTTDTIGAGDRTRGNQGRQQGL